MISRPVYPSRTSAHHGDAEATAGLVDLAVNVRRDADAGLAGRPDRRDRSPTWPAYPDPAAGPGRRRRPARPAPGRGTAHRRRRRGLRAARPGAARASAGRWWCTRSSPSRRRRCAPPATRSSGCCCDPADGFRLDPALVPADADLVMIGNPTNPTSVLHPARRPWPRWPGPGRVLVVDEAFADTTVAPAYAASRSRWPSRRDLPGLVVLRSLTKTWGLAGLRIGYLLGDGRAAGPAGRRPAALGRLHARAGRRDRPAPRPSRSRPSARSPPSSPPTATTWSRAWPTCPVYASRAARPARSCCCTCPAPTGSGLALRERGWAVRRGDTFPGLGPDWLRIAVRDTADHRRVHRGAGARSMEA